MEFRRALLRVAGELGTNDLEKLKFACSDQIPDAKRERIHSPIDLLIALEEKGLLASDKIDYLARQLNGIGRPALLSHFQQFGFTVNPESLRAQRKSEDTQPEARLNKFLLHISDKLTCSEIDRLAFAWCKCYLNKTPDQIHSAFQLFTLMTQRLAITPENLDVLYIELSEMGRQDLCRSIEDYYHKNGIKHGLYPYYQGPTSGVSTPSSSTASTPYNSHCGCPEFSSEPSTNSSSPTSTCSRPSDLSLNSSSNVSTLYSEPSSTSADHPTPSAGPHHNNQLTHTPHEHRIKPEEGNSIVMNELYKKQQEVKELSERLEFEQSQRKLESWKSSSIVDQHQSQIMMLQEALDQKNQEIQDLYKEFMDKNISSMQNMSLNHPPMPEEYYPMSCHPHGYCIIFNNYQFYQVDENHEQLMERGGADVDQRTLSDTFKFLQYNVEVYENLPSYDIVARMKEISSRDHSKFDSFICCILTHGEEGKVFGSDSLPVNLQDLTGLVKGTFCPSLIDKPKLFFVQACRGEREDKGVPIERDGTSSLPVEADYLFGYATPTGKAAYRSRRHGSWFISELCNVFNNNAHVMGLSSMMRKVNRSVSEAYTKEGYKQCTEVVDRLRREVKFLPSYPQNNSS